MFLPLIFSLFLQDRARKLADAVGGDALPFADLDNFHPEDRMILVNTTSVGMHPKIDETPIPKVCYYLILLHYQQSVGLDLI